MNKKFLALIISIMMLSSMFHFNSFLATPDKVGNITPKLTVTKNVYQETQQVGIQLSFSGIQSTDKTNSLMLELTYDNSSFEFLNSVNSYIEFNDKDLKDGKLSFLFTGFQDVELKDNEVVLGVNFKVKNPVISGIKTFTLQPIKMYDTEFNLYNVNGGKASSIDVELKAPEATKTPLATPTASIVPSATPTVSPTKTPVIGGVVGGGTTGGTGTTGGSTDGTTGGTTVTSPIPTTVDISPSPTSTIPGYPFTDISNHWAQDNIVKMARLGLIKGYPDRTILPDNKISRAEMCVLLVDALGYPKSTSPNLKFNDSASVPDWAKAHIQTAVEKKIITGYEDNTFRASNTLTRSELVVMLVNAYQYPKVTTTSKNFADLNSIPDWAKDFIFTACEKDILKGYPDNTIRPSQGVTRAEAITLILKCRGEG